MNPAEFDKFAQEYQDQLAAGLAASGEGPEYFAEYKIADIARMQRLLGQDTGGALQVLDFGAGIGSSVPYVHKHLPGAALTCLDVSQRSLDIAQQRFPDQARYTAFDGQHMPAADGQFDIAYAMCVFHHIPQGQHVALLQELRRVLKPGGSLYVFEHNPHNPLTRKVVRDCPFDENAQLIAAPELRLRLRAAGFDTVALRYRIFFPHALRALRPLERLLAWLPLGAQYFTLARK
jgi:SAM-dependent methyltransferase